MADDVNEQVFNEKQLYTGDVVGEDDVDGRENCRAALSSYNVPSDVKGRANSTELPADRGSSYAKSSSSTSAPAGRERRRKRASARATQIVFWLETKYDILYEVCSSFENWKEAPSPTYDFDLFWCDQAIAADRFMKLKPYQKMNHFVGMSSITRKNNLGRNLLRMRKQFPTEYRFFPDTWILPTDLSDFKLQFTPAKNKTFIIKPDNGCQGKGIFLIRDGEKVPVDFSTTYVAQRYIHKPFLLDGHKFDLRLYVLVMGCDPLRIFLHRRGLVRLASEQYVEPTIKNLTSQTVHLTNYAVNKMNPNFEENTNPDDPQDGHKRSWEAVAQHLREQDLDVDTMMLDIEDLIIKTLIAVQPSLSHFYHSCQPDDVENSMCFEILGFDVILDQKLQPWLLEVNHAPSFATESDLDRVVKHEVLRDTFNLLNLSPDTRRRHKREAREKMEQRAMGVAKKQSLEERMTEEHEAALARNPWEDANLNGYKRLYPSEEKEREYMQIHDAAINIWEVLMGGNSRRSVRLTQVPLEEEAKAKTDGKGSQADGDTARRPGEPGAEPREKRSVDEMREVVERLSAGVSARPRESCKTRRRAGKQDVASGAYESNLAAGNDEDAGYASGQGEVADEESKEKTNSKTAASAAENEPRPSGGRPEVQVGDVIKVQTNLGWENVIVKAKRTNGKIDIQFKDGEYMRSVLPRIFREPVAPPPPAGDGAGGLPSTTSEQQAHPKTARGNASGSGNGASSSNSKVSPPLPPPCSPVDRSDRPPQAPGLSSDSTAASSASRGGGQSAGVISNAANVIAGAVASDLGSAASSGSARGSESSTNVPQAAGEAVSSLSSLSSLTSLDKHLSAQLRSHRARASNNLPPGGAGVSDLPITLSTLPAGAVGGMSRGLPSGLRPPQAMAIGTLGIPSSVQEVNKVHEVRLRQQLQQLISVRPIVTRRKPSGDALSVGETPKSPRSATRRHTYGNR